MADASGLQTNATATAISSGVAKRWMMELGRALRKNSR
jgi:hypothetical protein